jgi:type IV pilus assembly protein PilA
MRAAARGFTLVELMIVVAIIGILASVAGPQFRAYQLRSRAAERAVLMKQVQASVSDLWVRNGKFPEDLSPSTSRIGCPANPLGRAGSQKRRFQEDLGQWSDMTMTIEGHVYYTYSVDGVAAPGARNHFITSVGDLDDDGVSSTMVRTYSYDDEQPLAFDEDSWGAAF